MFIVALARSSSDDNSYYVLPVLWMTSCFHIMFHMACGIGINNVSEQIVKFPMYSPGGSMLFDFVVVYNGSKWRTGGEV